MRTTFTVEEWVKVSEYAPKYKYELRYEGEDFADALTMLLKLFNDGKVAKLTARGIK